MKRTNDEILKAYSETGSVWKAAEILGICGQSVHERLQKLGANKVQRLPKWKQDAIRKVYNEGFMSGDGVLDALCRQVGMSKPNVSREARRAGITNIKRKACESLCSVFGDNVSRRIRENGHPKGNEGHKHSQETRDKISKASIISAAKKTPEERSEISMKACKTKIRIYGAISPPRQKTTWKQGWREFGGQSNYYRSRWEANYGRYLQWLKERGDIKAWEHEPETFWFEGIMRGVRSYLPDFRVTEKNGDIAYHEVKGWMDSKSKTKLKRMAKYHPEIKMVLIDTPVYKDIRKKMCRIIDGWEE